MASRSLIALTLAMACVALACGRQGAAVDEVPLSVLAAEQEAYDGRTVRARGTVRSYDDPVHFWIEDDVPNRVEIVPAEVVQDLVGLDVLVEGRFTFAEGRGRVIDADVVEPLGPAR